jgi:sulfonate transport system substrate-binding protein
MRIRTASAIAGLAIATIALTGCVAGETSSGDAAAPAEQQAERTLTLDWATYNPLSLVIKDQGWLEAELEDEGVTVEWVQSAGSNKANEFLRSGAIDVGSTAGSAALLARSNGSPIRTIGVYSQPEWAALVVPAGSDITSVADLAGRSVAATSGTDPYFFLVQALEEAGLSIDDVTVQNLQHADGYAALQSGAVDAWAGLDPIMGGAIEAGAEFLYRNVDFNSYGVLNATESFLEEDPDLAQAVIDAYEHAREWALANPEETIAILAEAAAIDPAVATQVIEERSNLDVSGIPGDDQLAIFSTIAPILVEIGSVTDASLVDAALEELLDPTYAEAADPARFDD